MAIDVSKIGISALATPMSGVSTNKIALNTLLFPSDGVTVSKAAISVVATPDQNAISLDTLEMNVLQEPPKDKFILAKIELVAWLRSETILEDGPPETIVFSGRRKFTVN